MLARDEIIAELERYFRDHEEQQEVDMAFLYGSWASGLPRKDSDIDLALVFLDDSCSERSVYERVTKISMDLSRKLGRDVNVLWIDPDFKRPALYGNAVAAGLPVYFRNFPRLAGIKNEALHMKEDFLMFGRRWQIQVAKQNLGTSDVA